MNRNTFAWLLAAGLLSLPLAAQMPEGYLDVNVVHVKMGKRMEFDAINKKMAEMNRKNGDRWTAYEVLFGDSNAVYFVSTRATFAAEAEGITLFENAIKKGLGDAGMHKLFNDSDAATESEYEILYRRRWDLSSAAPADLAASNKVVGGARWIRAVTTHTKPGKIVAYEAALRQSKEANERMNPGVPFWVSQSVAGTAPGTFRTVTLVKSLGDLDSVKTLQQAMGGSYASFQRTVEECVERIEITIARFLPELSNPPDDIAAVDPDFWHPKPTMMSAAPAKPKAAANKP